MKAIVYHGTEDFRVENVADPKLAADSDALIRVTRTAICGSDLHFWHGPQLPAQGFPMGHEFLGRVEEVGPAVRRFRPGDRVLAACTTGCGDCESCRRGLFSGCSVTTAIGAFTNVFGNPLLHGGQAEAARVPFADANLFRVPDALSDEQALFLTDILPTAWMGTDFAEVGPGDAAVVIGCGPVGVLALRAAEIRGASRIVAIDPDEVRLARARERGYSTVNPDRDEPVAAVRDLLGGGANAVIEAVGREALLRQAIDMAGPGGRIGGIGIVMQPEVQVPYMAGLTARNLTLRSGLVNPQPLIPMLLRLIEGGRIDPTEIITHRLSLDEGIDGYRVFAEHREDVLKVVLQP